MTLNGVGHVGNVFSMLWIIATTISASSDALPSPGVNPLEGSPKCNYGKRDLEGAPNFQL
jgi:hypothetical protein